MKRPTMLYRAMLKQISIDLEVSMERDFRYIESRFEHEGLSFLTITLPTLSDSLESGLETGRLTLPNGFKPFRRGGTLPAFLQGLFRRVFALDGSLLSEPCVESIYWIRQVARFYKKPKLPCSPKREAAAIARFKKIEEDLHDNTKGIGREDNLLDSVSRILWSTVFHTVDTSRILCGHGPGVTADRLLTNQRRRINYWYQRFESSFPVSDHAFHNYGEAWSGGAACGVSGITFISIADEPPVRVVFVPKTLQTPRVIAIEPSSMQFVQQGLSRYMTDIIEQHRLTCRSIRFSDQQHNRRLAYRASIDGRLATVDMSDASDRVHLGLVQRIFRGSPLLDYLEDARSLHATLPDGCNLVLRKYASMGSALCFPVEACVFYTLVLTAIMSAKQLRPSYSTIISLSRDISVFGDDLIFPSKYMDVVSDYLESYALRVNRRKSFSRSKFRESCGSDFYDGVSVLPVYARQDVPDRRSEWTPSHIMSWISTADQFYLKGKWHLSQCIRDMVESVLRVSLPRSRVLTSGLGFYSLLYDTKLRWHQSTYSFRQRRLGYVPLTQKDKIDGDSAACFNKVFERDSRKESGTFERHNTLYEWLCHDRAEPHWESNPDGSLRLLHQNDEGAGRYDQELFGTSSNDICGLSVRYSYSFLSRPTSSYLPRVSLGKADFHNTTKRGVFALKRHWATIIS